MKASNLFLLVSLAVSTFGQAVAAGLGFLPGATTSRSQANAVSNGGGVVVGYGTNSSGVLDALKWTPTGGMIGFNVGTATANGSAAGVSADGSWICGSGFSAGQSTAMRVDSSNTVHYLGYLSGDNRSLAYAISSDGTAIVGRSSNTAMPSSEGRAFRWTSSGGMQSLGTLNADSEAYAISGDGNVVGGLSIDSNGRTQAFRWTSSGGMVGLGFVSGHTASQIGKINSDGSVLVGGSSPDGGSTYHAAKWTTSNGWSELGELPGGVANSFASSVSGAGDVIVGTATDAVGTKAFVWDARNGMRNFQSVLSSEYGINFTGWTLANAAGIDPNATTVVGYGTDPNGDQQAFSAQINSRTSVIVSGAGYGGFHTSHLGGLNSAFDLVDGTTGAQRTVTVSSTSNGSGQASDVAAVSGTGGDLYVLQVTYDSATANSVFGGEANARLGWYITATGTWQDAVLGSSGATPTFVAGAYNSAQDFHVGYYGVDTVNHQAWAVVNQTGSFAVVAAQSPLVTISSATDVTATGATLTGAVNPNGVATTAQFEYSVDNNYGTWAPVTLSPTNGISAQTVSATLSGLQPGTKYNFRLIATNADGSVNGGDLSFTTLSTDANLSSLTLGSTTLSPSFSPATTNYTSSVGYNVSSITLTPTCEESHATVTVDGISVSSGNASTPLTLNVGNNNISIVVTAQDGSTKNYLVYVNRPPLAAVFNSATDVPITQNGYTPTGSSISFTLNFAPPTGTNLTVINNTGLAFINGTFNNLVQGQAVSLVYNGVVYNFIANYFGGTGNDLVLQWANVRLVAWGWNEYGQLGNNSTTNSFIPVNISLELQSDDLLISAAAGAWHSESLVDRGQTFIDDNVLYGDSLIFAWGYDGYGEMNNNVYSDSTYGPVEFGINGTYDFPKEVTSIAAGQAHGLASCSDGRVYFWGTDDVDNSDFIYPVYGGALTNRTVVAVAAGGVEAGFFDRYPVGFSLALCSDGTIAAWGDNYWGELGNNSTNDSFTPVTVDTSGVLAGKTVVAIAAGALHSLVLCSDGTLAAWGNNTYGQLGNNTTTNSLVPVLVAPTPVLSGKTVVAIAAGSYHSMALCSDGTVAVWGSNQSNQLANDTTNSVWAPYPLINVGALSGKTVVSIACGSNHSMALCSDGTVVAWGDNYFGQLGINSTASNTSTPTAVDTTVLAPGERFVSIASGPCANHSFATVASPHPTPSCSTLAATSITGTSATLNGTVTPNGGTTTVTFNYGTTPSYGTNVAGSPNVLSYSVSGAQNVQATITGLTPGTTYYARLVAVSGAGSAGGGQITFNTPNNNANLSNLALSNGSLSPLFSSSTTTYAVSVLYSVNSISVTPTVADGNATVTVNGTGVVSGQSSSAIVLNTGANTISVTVTAQDGITTESYTITVTRASPVPGDLDQTWAGTGIVTTAFGAGDNQGFAVSIQPDGKIVAVGWTNGPSNRDFAVTRYNTDGSLDGTFGTGGKVTTDVNNGDDVATAVVIQGDGRIVAAGYSYNGSNNDFAVVRYNTDGSLDTSFNGTGKLVTPIGSGDDFGQAITIQGDGKIVVAGSSSNGSNADFAAVRYNSNGSLDTSFNATGKVTTPIGNSDDAATGVAVQLDGKIVLGGYSYNGSNNDFAVVRYNSDGSLDTSFGSGGKLTTAIGSGEDVGQALALQDDGKILVAGYSGNGSNNDFALVRYNSNGSLDTSFNGTGKVTTTIGSGDDVGTCLTVQGDQKILVGGYTVTTKANFALVRYNSDGSLDTTFNSTGKVITSIGSGDDSARGVAVQTDGSIVLAGFTYNGSNDDLAVVRYVGNPIPALTLGGATGIGATAATINGSVDPNDWATTAQFQYGLTPSYGSSVGLTLSPSDGTSAQNVNATLSDLQVGTTYYYRLSATNSQGTSVKSGTFTTLTALPNWRLTWFGTTSNTGNSADLADPNGNGISNLVEYALNGDPTGNTTGASILPQASRSGTNTLQLTFDRYLDRTDLTLTVQANDTLTGTWTNLAQSVNGATFTVITTGATVNETGTGNARTVTVGDIYLMTDPAHPHRFMRLEVTGP